VGTLRVLGGVGVYRGAVELVHDHPDETIAMSSHVDRIETSCAWENGGSPPILRPSEAREFSEVRGSRFL